MAFADEKLKSGRRAIALVELELDFCTLTYGQAPCTASGQPGAECYNTRRTCQDPQNYQRDTKIYRFCEPMADFPKTLQHYPAVSGLNLAPAKLTPGEGLGYRASFTVSFMDFADNDRGIDPYVDNRAYNPFEQGTFFGKLLARNPFYKFREMRVRTGYMLPSGKYDATNFRDRTYVIDRINGPDANGKVTVTGKDVLTLADDDKAQCPVPSNGELASPITAIDTSLTLQPAGVGDDEYPASGRLQISNEQIDYATRVGDVFSGLTRGVAGSTAASHDIDDAAQLCYVVNGENVVQVVEDLIVNFANIDPIFVPIADWNAVRDQWLASFNLTTSIGEPMGVNKLLGELESQCLFNLFYDEFKREIVMTPIAPPTSDNPAIVFDDADDIIESSVTIVEEPKKRLSQVWVYYDMRDFTDRLEARNFKRLKVSVDSDAESGDQYGTSQVNRIFSRWFGPSNEGEALTLASRLINRYRFVPRRVAVSLDAKDIESVNLGDIVRFSTWQLQDETGASNAQQFETISIEETDPGSTVRITGLSAPWVSRVAFIGPDTLPDYDAATEEQKGQFAWICDDIGFFPDGELAYVII